MKKLIILGILGTAAVVAVVASTNARDAVKTVASSTKLAARYVSDLAFQTEKAAKERTPIKTDLKRIREDIADLDNEISRMVRPIAEYKFVIEKTRKEIVKSQATIDEQKKKLLGVVQELQSDPVTVKIGDNVYKAAKVRQMLQRDMENLKQLEKYTQTQQQVLEAKEASLKATQEQLAKVISKKREYEVRVAQLEVEDETLQIARIGSDVKIDSGKASQIESALSELEVRIGVERAVIETKNGELASLLVQERTRPVDLKSMRDYLEGGETTKTASSK